MDRQKRKVGSAPVESKNSKGGVEIVRYRTWLMPIYNVTFFNESFNVHEVILQFLSAFYLAKITCIRLFSWSSSRNKVLTHDFFKIGHLVAIHALLLCERFAAS